MSGYRNEKQKKSKTGGNKFREMLKKPWIFAGAALLLDTDMLAVGMILSGMRPEVEYTLTETTVERSQPFAFFGIIAAVAVGIVCVMVAFIIAGAFLKKRRAARFVGAAGLLAVSLVMIGVSALTALGFPPKSRNYISYSDENLRLIIEEEEQFSGNGTASFFLTDSDGSGRVELIASTDITEYSAEGEERYTVSWITDTIMVIGFEDGVNYRTIQADVGKYDFSATRTSE